MNLLIQFLGRIDLLSGYAVLSAHASASNWLLPFMNQQKWENGRRKYFMFNLHKSFVAGLKFEHATPRSAIRCAANCPVASSWYSRPPRKENSQPVPTQKTSAACRISFSIILDSEKGTPLSQRSSAKPSFSKLSNYYGCRETAKVGLWPGPKQFNP